jgi:protein gp37
MAECTNIEWTGSTWPVVQGCDYESPGCTNCYAVPLLWRMSHNPHQAISGPLQGVVAKTAAGKLHFTGKIALREDRLDWPLKWKEPRRIFLPSHGDLFHPSVPDWFIDKVFAVMALCPQHTFQVLTKRAKRMREYLANPLTQGRIASTLKLLKPDPAPHIAALINLAKWPLANVWAGVSTEDQPRADERIPELLATPAAVRFISAEPLLSLLNLVSMRESGWHRIDALRGLNIHDRTEAVYATIQKINRIDWVIAGGESGLRARPMHPDWARSLRDQCQAAGVAFFFKQWGEWLPRIDAAASDPGGRLDYGITNRDPAHYRILNLAGGFGFHGDRVHVMKRVGKKAAGAVLDGREWREFPQAAA